MSIDEWFEKLNGTDAHACYCPRSEDGCKCALKDEYLVEAKAQIETIIKEARIEEVRKACQLDYKYSSDEMRFDELTDYLDQRLELLKSTTNN
jgi:hypothetical protein